MRECLFASPVKSRLKAQFQKSLVYVSLFGVCYILPAFSPREASLEINFSRLSAHYVMEKRQHTPVSIEVAHRRFELEHYIQDIEDLYITAPEFSQFTRAFANFNRHHMGYKGHTGRLDRAFGAYARVERAVPEIGEMREEEMIEAMALRGKVQSEAAKRLLSQLVVARVSQGFVGTDTGELIHRLNGMAAVEAASILTSLGIRNEFALEDRLQSLKVFDILMALERGHLAL